MLEIGRNLRFTGALLVGALSACSGSNPLQPFDIIGVTVQGSGAGSGNVFAQDNDVLHIECFWPGNTGACQDDFEDAGGGGVFNLIALPNEGSVFAGWTGCNQVNGNICTLTFGQFIDDTSFAVTARFELGGATSPGSVGQAAPGHKKAPPGSQPAGLHDPMGLGRVELPTSRLSGVRSNHLSYRP